ncbi:MAG: cytochrome b/b6 domain-containing protein [Flavobacteriaceae bacterium]|nr:cytochrome b/b6 domain-containing protein [Flavobacteriaceae bacterium]
MEVKNDLSKKFDKGTIWIHWLTAILILALSPMGKYMSGLEPADKINLVKPHAILGIVVLVLTIFRTWFFFKKPRPEDLKTGAKFNDKLAVGIHHIFYFLLFGIVVFDLAMIGVSDQSIGYNFQ